VIWGERAGTVTIAGMGALPPLHRFTREEYERMVASGALGEDLRVELLDGRIVDVSPQGPEHMRMLRALMIWFAPVIDRLLVQMPLATTDDSEPEPDIAIAGPATAALVIEVAVTQRAQALGKAAIYAAAGIPEYWIIDVPAREALVHRQPTGARYAASTRHAGADVLHPPADLPPRSVAELFAAADAVS